jgi:hypothetical protein
MPAIDPAPTLESTTTSAPDASSIPSAAPHTSH